jgi:undecaprenyl-phosphate 4-deoxy-4-formamido-L-arabinose transferase
VYVDGLIFTVTKSIGSVCVQHHPRKSGVSGYSVRKSVSLWLKTVINFSILPLRITSITGLLISFVGFILAILVIIQKFTFNEMPVGWSSLMVTILVIGGLQLLAIGVVGEYLGRVYFALNSRPQYTIADRVGLTDQDDR